MLDRVKEYIEVSGNGKWCEDKTILCDECVGIMDGATPIEAEKCNNFPTQACWFVNAFANEFIKTADLSVNTLPGNCLLTTKKISSQYHVTQSYNSPCGTAAFVVLDTMKAADIFVIGDCHVYIQTNSGELLHYSDDRVSLFSQKTLAASNLNKSNRADAVKRQKIENRSYLNKPDGFYAIDLGEEYIKGFKHYTLPAADINKILLCTDGFARAFIEYEMISPDDFFSSGISLTEMAYKIKKYESDERAGMKKCVKKADDLAAIILEL